MKQERQTMSHKDNEQTNVWCSIKSKYLCIIGSTGIGAIL